MGMTHILDVSMHIIIYIRIVLLYHRADESLCVCVYVFGVS